MNEQLRLKSIEIEKIIYEFIKRHVSYNINMFKSIYFFPINNIEIYYTSSEEDNEIEYTITIKKSKDKLVIKRFKNGNVSVENSSKNIDTNTLNNIYDKQERFKIDKIKTNKRSNILAKHLTKYDGRRFIQACDKLGILSNKTLYPTIEKTVDFWIDIITMYIKDISYSEIEGFRNKLTVITTNLTRTRNLIILYVRFGK